MSEEKLYQLWKAYFNNTIAPEDCAELLKYLRSLHALGESENETTLQVSDIALSEFEKGVVYTEEQSNHVYNKILSDHRFRRKTIKPIAKYNWLKYAASLVVISASILYLAINYYAKKAIEQVEKIADVQIPVSDTTKVTLSTSNGTSVALDSLNSQNGQIDIEGNKISKTGERALAYENGERWLARAVFHTLSVPRGKTYRVQLPDGTNVWLNSATSLTYPSEFLGKERKVILNGEAYFEVAKNPQKPFIIEANGSAVQVLGTHFNVSAYKEDEEVITTLLEGAVKVSNPYQTKELIPGKQATVKINQKDIGVKMANIEEVMAWKNGYFVFVDDDIKSIMKDLMRWYDIEVTYKEGLTNERFGGTFSKSKSLDELLQYLETLGTIHFKIVQGDAFGKGRRVIVMP